jgi:tungstate transport system substrate-binding protein
MRKNATTWIVAIILTAIVSVSGTIYYFGVGPFAKAPTRTKLVVSTTTSLYDTGLLDEIEDQFEANNPTDVYFISAGTGIAIQYAQRGDADMILVHAPSKEQAFLEGGYGVCRKIIAHNFFTIVGPEEDPAGIKGLMPVEALRRIVESGRKNVVEWVSRGDDSGTNTKEKGLWSAAGFEWSDLRTEDWYLESGTGMGKTLQISNEKNAYTLADMGTYLKYYTDELIALAVIVDAGEELLNVYSAIAVDPQHNPEVNYDAAINFMKFLSSEEGQEIFEKFGEDEYPERLFYPSVELLKEKTDTTLLEWIEEFAFFDGEECPQEYQRGCSELFS